MIASLRAMPLGLAFALLTLLWQPRTAWSLDADGVAPAADASPVDAAAEDTATTVEVGGLVGWHHYSADSSLGRLGSAAGTAIVPALRYGGRIGVMLSYQWIAECELDVTLTEMRNQRASLVMVGLRPHVVWDVMTTRLRPFVLAGLAGLLTSPSNPLVAKTDLQIAAELGVGAKFDLEDWYGLRLDARGQLQDGMGSAPVGVEWGVLLGVYGRFPTPKKLVELANPTPPDGDGDGLVDELDRCPDQAGTLPLRGCPADDRDGDGLLDVDDQCPRAAGSAANKGCPPEDADGDGVKDAADKCPDKRGAPDNGGCPWPDTDGDGVADRDDRCPALAGTRGAKGCPDADADRDGVPDHEDRCPALAGVKSQQGCPEADLDGDGVAGAADKCPEQKGLAELAGCPDPDADGDGIADRFDKCPDQPAGKSKTKDGCPDGIPAEIRAFFGTVGGIDFEPGSAVLAESSLPVLDKAAELLRKFTGFRVEVSGHTDNTGSERGNRRVSQQRAEAVVRYLVRKGVVARRLVAVGNGPDKPVASNDTPDGRKANRRVDFRLLSR